ncbi:MAG: ABC transporter permease [Acidimicrobiia bacterium]|nr:ABC transporter permease [Acidimicrobiia bacterium]
MAVETPPRAASVEDDVLDTEIAGLDALEIPRSEKSSLRSRLWGGTWPKLIAIGLVLSSWQAVVWSGWRPPYLLPGPVEVFETLFDAAATATFWQAILITMQRAAVGFALAIVIGTVIGFAVSRSKVLRSGVGSLITGLQSMPSIAWFPLAILLFRLSETAILFVVVIGAAPSIANGLITGIDHIPPLWMRAGKVLGARGFAAFRHIVLPGAMPGYVAGLKQGWAFAWRSLMAGELLVIIANRPSVGALLQFNRDQSDAAGLLAMMVVILAIGIAVDTVFGAADRAIRARRGLVDTAA